MKKRVRIEWRGEQYRGTYDTTTRRIHGWRDLPGDGGREIISAVAPDDANGPVTHVTPEPSPIMRLAALLLRKLS